MNRRPSEPPTPRTALEWPVSRHEAGVRLDKFLAAPSRLRSRAKAFAAIERGKVFIGNREAAATDAGRALAEGDVVRVWMDRPGSASVVRTSVTAGDLDILFEDEAMIVVNKPAGLLSVPLERKGGAASVFDLIEAYLRPLGKRRPLVVHRIDQDTSGLVVFARDARAQSALKAQFKRREPARIYLAVVYGHPQPSAGTWRDRLVWDTRALIQKATHPRDPAGTEAISQYQVRERYRDAALIEVRLVTGRRNQIRLQARLRGHPLVGEKRYTHGGAAERTIPFERHALHAWRLAFRHPVTRAPMEFEAPLPRDLDALLARLRRTRVAHQ
jgi:23S rRNA pseudouridine1911/1915/1917 synthase